jgi:hypothetical protein
MAGYNALLGRDSSGTPDNALMQRVLFLGERSRTADHEALARAKELESAGTHPTEIHRATGWFKTPEGRWNYESGDDSRPEIEKAYPGLARRAPLKSLPEGVGARTEELAGGPAGESLFDMQHAVDKQEGYRYKRDQPEMDDRSAMAVMRGGLSRAGRAASMPWAPPVAAASSIDPTAPGAEPEPEAPIVMSDRGRADPTDNAMTSDERARYKAAYNVEYDDSGLPPMENFLANKDLMTDPAYAKRARESLEFATGTEANRRNTERFRADILAGKYKPRIVGAGR